MEQPTQAEALPAARAALEVLERTALSIGKQLELISERAKGDFLDKRPVVQTLRMHQQRAEKAAAALRSELESLRASQQTERAVPGEVLAAISTAGFTLIRVVNGYSLVRLGKVETQMDLPGSTLIKRGEWDALSLGAQRLLTAAAAPVQQAAPAVLSEQDIEDWKHCYWVAMHECESAADDNNNHLLRCQVEGFYRLWERISGQKLKPAWLDRAAIASQQP